MIYHDSQRGLSRPQCVYHGLRLAAMELLGELDEDRPKSIVVSASQTIRIGSSCDVPRNSGVFVDVNMTSVNFIAEYLVPRELCAHGTLPNLINS
ncbi:hypothetical protein EVAR_7549_1 [Eumeta japonica]|uniref:Uncharacterized protein n=1 Tax=Eumeta variegata TaxID=151549 RepID=A0A4C1VPT5_EUMVA|nr:hypothetical protein EVAR_7549_1 [Eumeta japonica]